MSNESEQPHLITSVFAGLVSGLVTLTYSVTYAALIFSGLLSSHLSIGVSMALISAAVVAFIVALKSSFSFAIAGPDSNASAILALMCSTVALQIPAGDEEGLVSTILMIMILSTLLVGLAQYFLGKMKLGYLVRFIPYPVLGGFLAGTGWLIVDGSFDVMTNTSIHIGNVDDLFGLEMISHWLPGVLFAIVLRLLMKRYQHFLILPCVLLASVFLTHLALWFSGVSAEKAWEANWLFEPFPSDPSIQIWSAISFPDIHWSLILYQSGELLAMTSVVIITILLNATGIELATAKDAELDKEMTASGAANLCTGFLGGMIGYLSISRSLLNYKAGGFGKVSGIVAAVLCALVLFFGSSFLVYLPRLVLGGLLFYLGFVLLVEWVVDAWHKLSRLDYALVMVIMLSIAVWGFVEGVSLGLLISVILFVVNYSQINIVKLVLSGANHRSSFVRPLVHEEVLKKHGEDVYILTLQGYLFFGTASNLHEQVRSRLISDNLHRIRFLVIDFRLVTGLDSSVTLSFIKIKRLTEREGVMMCITNLSQDGKNQFMQGGLCEEGMLKFFSNLDYCVQWCEDQILDEYDSEETEIVDQLDDQLVHMFLNEEETELFMKYLERTEIEKDQYVVKQGDGADSLYFIESGYVSALLEQPDGEKIRLMTMGKGTVFGEMGLYTREPRSASIKTEEKSALYQLNLDALEKMELSNPAIAMKFHRFVIRLLASRIALSNRKVRMLLQ